MVLNQRNRLWLDLGCGGSPKGDINIDLYMLNSPCTNQKILPSRIPNFIQASVGFSPIRDGSMYGVKAYHLIEHSTEPTEWIEEMVRIAQKWVIIAVPNNPVVSEHSTHFYSWSKTSLTNLMSLYGEVKYCQTRFMWWNSDTVFGLVSRIPVLALRRLIYHTLNRLFGLEIVIVVDVS